MTVRLLLWMLGSIAAGVVLIVWGLRGKRLNHHPVCKQCTFDLSGAPEGTITCPECGAGLKRAGSVRIGQRRRRPIAMALGALLAALPGVAIGTAAFAMLTGTDVNAYKPLGLLIWEAKRTDQARSQAIAKELVSRYTAKKLDDNQIATTISTALAIQGNTERPWCEEWGDFLEQARSDKKVSDADAQRFWNQAAVLDWKFRPRVRAGDPIPVIAALKEARIGGSTSLQSMISLDSVTLDGLSIVQTGFMGMNPNLGWLQLVGKTNRVGWNSSYGEAKVLATCPNDAKPGRHTVALTILLQTKPQANRTVWNPPTKSDPETRTVTHQFEIDVVETGEKGIEVVEPTAELKEKMEQQLDPKRAQIYSYQEGQPPQASISFDVDGCPVPAAFDVLWRVGERTWKVGTFTTGTSADMRFASMRGPGMDKQRYTSGQVSGMSLDTDKADIILRPSTSAALRTIDVNRMYGGEIVYKNVIVDSRDMTAIASPVRTKSSAKQSTIEDAPAKDGTEKAKDDKKGPGLFKSLHKAMGGGS